MNELQKQGTQMQIHSMQDIKIMADTVAKSGLFGVKRPEQAMALMLLSQAQGLHPMLAVQKYHIIDGKPSMKSDSMLAEFQKSGGKIQWLERTDNSCSATFNHPSGGELTVTWTIKMAVEAELSGRTNWKQYPRQMLSARVVSEGVRALAPAIVEGIYTPEEIKDFQKDITPSEKLENIKQAEIDTKTQEHGTTNNIPKSIDNQEQEALDYLEAAGDDLVKLKSLLDWWQNKKEYLPVTIFDRVRDKIQLSFPKTDEETIGLFKDGEFQAKEEVA